MKAFLVCDAGFERSVGFVGGALLIGQHAGGAAGFSPQRRASPGKKERGGAEEGEQGADTSGSVCRRDDHGVLFLFMAV